MDALATIASWLSDHEAAISGLVGIAVLTGFRDEPRRTLELRQALRAYREMGAGGHAERLAKELEP